MNATVDPAVCLRLVDLAACSRYTNSMRSVGPAVCGRSRYVVGRLLYASWFINWHTAACEHHATGRPAACDQHANSTRTACERSPSRRQLVCQQHATDPRHANNMRPTRGMRTACKEKRKKRGRLTHSAYSRGRRPSFMLMFAAASSSCRRMALFELSTVEMSACSPQVWQE